MVSGILNLTQLIRKNKPNWIEPYSLTNFMLVSVCDASETNLYCLPLIKYVLNALYTSKVTVDTNYSDIIFSIIIIKIAL